jgi:hypothetical protein
MIDTDLHAPMKIGILGIETSPSRNAAVMRDDGWPFFPRNFHTIKPYLR